MDMIFQFYGLDWGALFFGLIGCNMVTQRQRDGFIYSAIGCICGFSAAFLSGQYGFIVYNAIIFCMMIRGYSGWARKDMVVALGAE